ncbi:uncharacterized protein LOC129573405 [Sitodiplosis mosellana]|uniref:uncharacterized protein LOC129573405 n=1 Tax=Sitodiplosis mosellana TaxID=263140 RepID=UPI002443B07B|nr:uncharacterized protein LOC129573405 [Sitodiplosis mosellana]
MTIVHKCFGFKLKNSPFWMIVAITIGSSTLAGSIWIAYEIFRTNEPISSNVGGLMKYLYAMFIFKTCPCVKEFIVKMLCVINLFSSPSWFFGIIKKNRPFLIASLFWWTIVLLFIFFPYTCTSVLNEIIQRWKQSDNTTVFVFAIVLHCLATGIFVTFYVAAVICVKTMKGGADVDHRVDVLQRKSLTNSPTEIPNQEL